MKLTIPSASTVVGRLLRLPLRVIPDGALVPILSGPMRGRPWIVGSGPHGCWMGTYEREGQQLLKRLVSRGDVVYDIGANVGFYTLLASELVGETGQVVSFEPLPRNVEFLRRHVRLHGRRNIVIVDAAVGNRDGDARFSVSTRWSENKLDETGEIGVRVVSLDSYVQSGAPVPMVMKIDVEGAEDLVLAGARRLLRDARPAIMLSLHTTEAREVCLRALREADYSVLPMSGQGSSETESELFATPR